MWPQRNAWDSSWFSFDLSIISFVFQLFLKSNDLRGAKPLVLCVTRKFFRCFLCVVNPYRPILWSMSPLMSSSFLSTTTLISLYQGLHFCLLPDLSDIVSFLREEIPLTIHLLAVKDGNHELVDEYLVFFLILLSLFSH
jgi:hypothetical protein